MNERKRAMFCRGVDLLRAFCDINRMPLPAIQIVEPAQWMFGKVCAYYRPTYISMCVERTAHVGLCGQQWSYPGYVIDRTPYGVLAHELGHHADVTRSTARGAYFGDYSAKMRHATGEKSLTGYCPNDAEWFAEMFRLFATNPDLLRNLRPRAWEALRADFEPAITTHWRAVLDGAPARTVDMAAQKIVAAA